MVVRTVGLIVRCTMVARHARDTARVPDELARVVPKDDRAWLDGRDAGPSGEGAAKRWARFGSPRPPHPVRALTLAA